MSLIINIPDLDDSASLLPVLTETVAGFPVIGLQGLYLFEDGDVGSIPTRALDSSGLGAHAPLATGSTITRSKEGVTNGDAANAGFEFRTPIPVKGSATILLAVRDRQPPSSPSSYSVLWAKSRNVAFDGTALGNSGQTNRTTDGYLLLNLNSAGSQTTPAVQVFAQKSGATAGVKWDGAAGVGMGMGGAGARAQFFIVALSFDAVTGIITGRGMGQTVNFTSLADLTTWLAPDGNHVFGDFQFNGSGGALGDLGLAAFYAGAKSIAELDALVAAGRARMASRGVAAL